MNIIDNIEFVDINGSFYYLHRNIPQSNKIKTNKGYEYIYQWDFLKSYFEFINPKSLIGDYKFKLGFDENLKPVVKLNYKN